MTALILLLVVIAAVCTTMAVVSDFIAKELATENDAFFASRAAKLLRAAYIMWAVVIFVCVVYWNVK